MDAISAAKEGKAPGRCGIPAEIWKHTWRYETRHLDFLRREKFCSKAWFKQEHTATNFPCAQGTFYLTSCGPLRRGITWRLQGALDPQLLSFGLWLVSDVHRTQSCYWVDKPLAQRVPVHPDAEKLPPTDWSILIDKEHNIPNFWLSVASLNFLWVLSVARNSSLQCLQNSFTR